ncbi:MAG: HmuY family protein [Bacteroidales bacterium]|nr:HmuY family protein [Bacteroidales bacterium]
MMQANKLILLFIMMLLFQSCFKEDEMVSPHPRGDVKTDTIPMMDNYLYQVYFNLDSAKIVRSNVKTSFDLGFECRSTGWHIILNSSNFMKVADLGQVTFGQSFDTAGVKLRFDKSDGNPDSTAIGAWFSITGNDTISNNHVYAISRGLDELGNPLGLYQVIFDSLKNNTYYFRYAPLKGGSVSAGAVSKDPLVNYQFFSLKTGTVMPVEPPKLAYDLLFTQYTTLLFTDQGIPYPYLVTGVLINRYQVEVAVDSSDGFLSISREKAMAMNFTKSLDAVGYDWKYYNFDTGVYTLRPNLYYIIRNGSGYYFKLRFVGFYNKDGLKGYPIIEYQLL